MRPFQLVLRELNIDNKKDFSLSFETFDVIFTNLIYNTISVKLHPKTRITISELYFISTILGAIARNC